MKRAGPAAVLLLAAISAPASSPAAAQSFHLTGVSTVQYVSARALREDSVPISATIGQGVLRYTANGAAVRCLDATSACRYLAPGRVLHALPLTQDLALAGWGFGRGVRLQAQFRIRPAAPGDAELWPRADDRFDALEAYLEVARSYGRLRLGRQWQSSGLGTYSYDGASVQLRRGVAALDLYGGWSLVRGLSEPVTSDALASLEPFAPDARAVLLGTRLQLRLSPAAGGSVTYQREIRSDRLGLYSERLSSDASYRTSGWTIAAATDVDLATRVLSHLRLQASARPRPDLELELFARRYRPYFDLWTIWGAFAPVGFSEIGGGASLTPATWPVGISLDAASRRYADTDARLSFAPLRNTGWRMGTTVSSRWTSPWSVSLRYGADVGFGAARSELSARVQRLVEGGGRVGAHATMFDRASDYQLTDGVVLGGGVDAAWPLRPSLRASGHLLAYRHLRANATTGPDWTQLRGMLQLEWTLGSEPGLAGGTR
jgi:hypothetical protein